MSGEHTDDPDNFKQEDYPSQEPLNGFDWVSGDLPKPEELGDVPTMMPPSKPESTLPLFDTDNETETPEENIKRRKKALAQWVEDEGTRLSDSDQRRFDDMLDRYSDTRTYWDIMAQFKGYKYVKNLLLLISAIDSLQSETEIAIIEEAREYTNSGEPKKRNFLGFKVGKLLHEGEITEEIQKKLTSILITMEKEPYFNNFHQAKDSNNE